MLGGIEAVVGCVKHIAARIRLGIDLLLGRRCRYKAAARAALGVIADGSRVNFHPALAAAAHLVGGKAEHSVAVVLGRAAVVNVVARFIARVVANDYGDVFARRLIVQLERHLGFFTGLGLLRLTLAQNNAALALMYLDIGNILVVLHFNGQLAAFRILLRIKHLRRSAVHGERIFNESAVAQLAGGNQLCNLLCRQFAVLLIILGDHDKASGELVALVQSKRHRRNCRTKLIAIICPFRIIAIVEHARNLIVYAADCDIAVCRLDIRRNRSCIADQSKAILRNGGAAADGLAACGIFILNHIGVDGIDADIARARIDDAGIIGIVVIADVRAVRARAVEILNRRAAVDHGRIRPVAVEAQNRDGVDGTQAAVGGIVGLHIDVALDVCAVFIHGIQRLLLRVGQLHGNADVDAAANGNFDGGGVQLHQQQMRVIRRDLAVGIQIRSRQVVAAAVVFTGNIADDCLRVQRVGLAVAVDVAVKAGDDFGVVAEIICKFRVQRREARIQIRLSILVRKDVLREQVGVDVIALCAAGDVVDGKACGIRAIAVGVIAELGLDLTVGGRAAQVSVHHDIGLGVHRAVHICKTRALVEDGVRKSGVGLNDGRSRGHEQTVDQLTVCHAIFAHVAGQRFVLADVLRHQRSHTGDLRRGHGRTGHIFVCVLAAERCAIFNVRAVDRIDVAAGRGDFRLELQAARNAPGAEIAHAIVVCGLADADCARRGQLAGVVRTALCGRRLRQDHCAVSLCNRNGGRGARIAAQIHVDCAGLIVVDDNSLCARVCGVRDLVHKADCAAADEYDLAADVNAVKICRVAKHALRHEHIVQLAAQRGERIVCVGGFAVKYHLAADAEIVAGCACVVNGGNRQRVGIRSGRAAGLERNVVAIEVAVLGVLCPVAAVAGGDADDCALAAQCVKALLNVRRTGEAGIRRAKRQVDRVAAKDNRVLNCGHVIGVVCAAAIAKDLHHDQLRIGRNALHLGCFQRVRERAVGVCDVLVCCGDTGNVRAVLALLIVHVGDFRILVHIVIGKRNLVVTRHSGGRRAFRNIQLAKHIGNARRIQNADALFVRVQRHARVLGQKLHRVVIACGAE